MLTSEERDALLSVLSADLHRHRSNRDLEAADIQRRVESGMRETDAERRNMEHRNYTIRALEKLIGILMNPPQMTVISRNDFPMAVVLAGDDEDYGKIIEKATRQVDMNRGNMLNRSYIHSRKVPVLVTERSLESVLMANGLRKPRLHPELQHPEGLK